jgi:mannose-6-phosphate isomerase-like protein (cupin superfamily)
VKPVISHRGGFRWQGVSVEAYKSGDAGFRDATRQVLFGGESGGASELRYFELAPAGYTTLERHAHVHEVMILLGTGRVLVGTAIYALGRFDLVRVPPGTWHQFRAGEGEPLGFLCLVDRERDRPERPTPEQLSELRAGADLAEFIRV